MLNKDKKKLEAVMNALVVEVYAYGTHDKFFQTSNGDYVSNRCIYHRGEMKYIFTRMIDRCADVEIKDDGMHVIIVDEASCNL